MAGQKQCHAPDLQDLGSSLSDLSNEVLFVFVLLLVLSKIDKIRNQYLRCVIARSCICIIFLIQIACFSMYHIFVHAKVEVATCYVLKSFYHNSAIIRLLHSIVLAG